VSEAPVPRPEFFPAPRHVPPTAEPHRHLGYLDSMRALAALYVVANHALLQVHESYVQQHSPVESFFLNLLRYGPAAVAVFIVLSGFCLTLPVIRHGGVLRDGARAFFLRRAWRILPPYYLSIALSLALIWLFIGVKTGTHWDTSLPVTPKGVVTHLLLVQDFFHESATINHVLWSVAVEWRIYFIFPLLLIWWRKFTPSVITLIMVSVSCVVAFISEFTFGNPLHFHYFGLFTLGIFACGIAYSREDYYVRWQNLPWNGIVLVLTVSMLAANFIPLYHGGLMPLTIRDVFVGLWASCFLVLTSRQPHAWHHRLLSFKPLVFVGTFAYSIYLIHAPLLQLLWQYAFQPLVPHPTRMLLALLLSIPLIVVASYLFYLLFERPFIRGRHKAAPTAR
jgi:peptidoglycan/LPS O-acetylase OafA/YrhL